jgi:hypothetical protein
MPRLAASATSILIALLTAAGPAAACLPYTFDDDEWNLELGVRWAVRGTVIDQEQNDDLPGRPHAMIIRIDGAVVGSLAERTIRIAQADSCDGFWYGPGDSVIVALPAYDHWHEPPRPLAVTLDDLENDTMPVWRLDGDRVLAATGRSPRIDGRRLGTVDELVAALVRLPDTATASPPEPPTGNATAALSLLAGAAAIALLLRWPAGRLRQRRAALTVRS